MSTVAPPASPGRIEEAHHRIRHPLDRLRKYINTYVFFEALGLIGLVLALAFWAGFWLDFGVFKLLTFDWVQVDTHAYLRGFVLVTFTVLMIALVVLVVSTRFFKEFRDGALAMVLEKRFPKELGGRVITAVELHNPREAAKYGYSPALVAQTIQEAADRVETVPVADVFAWKRLYTYGFVLLYLTIGTYLLTAAGFCANRAAQNRRVDPEYRHPALTGFNDFHDVAIIWAERNLLLRNVIWPCAAHLELIPLDPREKSQPGYEPRIARDQAPPTLRVVAWKFVKTDRTRPEGLRQVTWQDLRDDPALASGAAVPELIAHWTPRDAAGLTVDEVELRLDAFTVRKDRLPNGEKLPATYCTVEPDGKTWRALTWGDLTQEKLGGLPVRQLPPEWDPTTRAVGMVGMGGVGGFEAFARGAITTKLESLTIDDVQKVAAAAEKETEDELARVGLDSAATEKAKARKALLTDVRMAINFLDHLAVLRETLDGVETRANQRGMRRNMRKLEVPATAALYYYGKRTTSRVSMNPVGSNEFTGTFAELKETVSYFAVGADYVTPVKRLIVVELPRLDKLESEEERPGYLYYRPSDPWKPSEMRGKRQRFEPIGVSLSGDASTIEVPMSTSLTLHGLSSKPLKGVTIVEFEKLKSLLVPLRQVFEALLAVEAKQEKRKVEPWIPAASRLLKTFGKDEKEHEVTALVKELSSTDRSNDLEAIASALAAGGEQGKQLADLFDKAKAEDKDKTLADAVPDLTALARLIKDVRDLVKNQVLVHLSIPRLTGSGEKTFTLAVADLRREQKFTLEFEDTDDVKGRRAVLIQPREDVAPRIREFNPDDVVRKGKEGFLVSAAARIPFKGRVRDDHGLARVRFACKVTPADFLSDQKYLALNGVAGILPACRPETRLLSLMYLGLVNRTLANSSVDEAGEEQLVDLPVFQMQLEANKLRDGRSELLAPETVKGLLAAQQREPYRRLMGDFVLSPDKWTDNDEDALEPRRWVKAQDPRAPLYFDLPLWALRYNGEPLKESAADKPQKRYLVEVRLLADDVYTEGTEFIPAVVFDPRRDEEKGRLKKAIDVLRPYVTSAASKLPKRAENEPVSPLASLSQVLGEKAGTVDLLTIGKGLVTPEADAMLAAAEAAVAGDEKGLKAIAEIRELTKEREPLPHTSPSSETFSFLVVPEFELMSRIGEEEEAKQKDLLKMMKPIREGRDRMADAVLALSGNTNEQILNSVLARCDTVDDNLKTAHADAISVRNAYDRIVREQRLNQMEENVTAKMFREVALPLGKVVDVQFDRALNAVKTLRRAVDNKDATVAARANDSRPKAAEAQKQLDTLMNDLNDIIVKMKGITELKEILLLLEDIYGQEVKLHELAQMAHRALLKRLLNEGNKP